eukprot:gene8175-8366_t
MLSADGGTDYLPRLIHHFAEQPDIDVLVSEDAGHVHGVVGGSRRGSSMFLFGLRVCESARGRGVARKLMEAICERGMEDSSISTITSATTPDNAGANRIFNALGFHHSHTVDLWPAYSALGEYEAAVGFVPGESPAPPPGQITMLDFIPGVRDLTSQASVQLGVGVDDWMCCSSMKQLHEAVMDVRKQQLRHPDLQQECQADADRAFLIAVALPLLTAAVVLSYLLRPPPSELTEQGQIFEDESTGFFFQSSEEGAQPERDKDGLLAFRPVSYTPWPVASTYEGERIRINVGPVDDRKPRTFVFNKVLPQPSEILAVTLPRPIGVVFEYDFARKQVFVAGVVEGGPAEQKLKVAGLNPSLAKESVKDGDVLRAVTCTNFVYPTKALFGAVPPQRHVVVYGADKQAWGSIKGALRKGERRDGPITLILERRSLAGVHA